MKYKNIKIALCTVLGALPIFLTAQSRPDSVKVEAVVRNTEGAALQGVRISDGGSRRSITDENGNFVIETVSGRTLQITSAGYKSQLISIDSTLNEILLVPEEEQNIVHVAFQTVDRKDLNGGISVLDMPELIEKNYINYSLDNLGSLTGGFTGDIWNMGEYMVLIDGIPRDAGADIQALEIEQISVLKGINAVALYGSRAAKGVIQITTKRGAANEKKVNFRVNTGIFTPKVYPKYLGSAEYMTLYNEARQNDGLEKVFSDEAIWHHAQGANPYRYPDVNYYSSEYLKKVSNRSDIFSEISGGNDRAQFYTNIGFVRSNSLLKFGEANNDFNNRLNLRGNIDLKLNDFISTSVDAVAIYNNGRNAFGDFWGRAASVRPHRFAPLIPISYLDDDDESSMLLVNNSNYVVDGKYLLGGTRQEMANAFADMYAAGYNQSTLRQFQFTNTIKFDLAGILDGLAFNTLFGIDYSSSYNQSMNNEYAVYEPIWNNYAGVDKISRLEKIGEDRRSGVQNISNTWQQQTIAFSGFFDYNKQFKNAHNLSGILVATGHQRSESENYHKIHSHVNLGLQLGYNYLHKYYADFSGAMLHSAKLAPGNRQAFSPTLSLGWRLSEEDFLKQSSIVDDLKLTASAGIVNTDVDINGYYLYQELHAHSEGAWYGWRDGSIAQTTDSRRGENRDLTFIKRKEINVGLEASLFNRLLTAQTTFFYHRFDGFLTQPQSIFPSYFTTYWPVSSFIPFVNYNNDQRAGVDFNLTLHQQSNDLNWSLGVVGAFYTNKALRREELNEENYQNRAGKNVDAMFGLVNNGFFMDEDDIANSPRQEFGEVKPGDIKYIDQNGDGVIDFRDEVKIGRWTAPFSIGVHYTAQWKNFTFFALANGHFGAQGLKNNPYYWISGDQKYSEVVRERWTEETKQSATYPRLTSISSDNNFRTSDFWLFNTDRFNLAKVQITYNFPSNMFRNSVISGLGVYVGGSDLLTISKERKYLEMNIGSAPQTRFYNLGITTKF